MKSIVAAGLLALACLPVWANHASDVNITVGPFYLSDSILNKDWGTGMGITVDHGLRRFRLLDLDGCASLVYFSNYVQPYNPNIEGPGYKVSEYLMPLTLRATTKFGSGAFRPYVGVGYGVAFELARFSSPGDQGPYGALAALEPPSTDTFFEANACYELIGGLRLGDKWNVEVSYLDGGNMGNTGFSASLGARF